MANLITSDFGWGGDAYPGEEPQAEAFQRDYTDTSKPYSPPEKKSWVVSEGRLFLDENVPHEDAAGTLEIEHNWHATFTVLHSGISLRMLGKILKKWCSEHNLQLKQMVDRQGILLPWNKTADYPGIGEINPGVKDWKNKEWSQESMDTDYPGFQNPTRGNEPSIEFDDKPMKCPHCGIELENQAEWLMHQMYAHEKPLSKPPAPPVDLDQALPANYNEVSRGAGEPGITTGKVAAGIDPNNWYDTYTGDDAIRVPFLADWQHDKSPILPVKWIGVPGGMHSDVYALNMNPNFSDDSGEVVFTTFGKPQIHLMEQGFQVTNADADDPRYSTLMSLAKRKMIEFKRNPNNSAHNWMGSPRPVGWANAFRLSSEWDDDPNISEDGTREWYDTYVGDDAIRVPFYRRRSDGRIIWVGNPGDHHGRSDHLFSDDELDGELSGGEVVFTNFAPPVIHDGVVGEQPLAYTDPRATEAYMKARQKMMEWRKQIAKGQTHYPDRWDHVPDYSDWESKALHPGWAQSFKLTAEAPIAGPIPWLYDEKGDKLYVGHPGDGPKDVQAPDYNAFGVVEGYYFPDGELRIMETSNIPITIRHLIKLWYYMHPELEVKKVMLEFTDLGGVKKRQKLAAENVAAKVHQLLVADPAAHTAALALGQYGNVYVVGGAIRDLALGREPKDIDLMVQGLTADQIENILKRLPGRVDFTGKAFGVFRYRTKEGFDVEIAMPRTEASTGAGHKDFEVKTDPHLPIESDLARRDFTGNAMAFDLKRGELIDPYNGWEDLQNRKLRTTSEFSFPDDPLRIMRGLASRSRHGLIPDEETKVAMRKNAPNLKHLPAERIQAELDKLMGGHDPAEAIRLAQETGVLDHFLPELARTHGFDQQNKYHNQELFDHTMTVLDHVAKNSDDKDLRYMAMLHDIGKPDSKWIDDEGWAHYYENEHGQGLNHEHHGADMTRELMQRLKFPRARTERVEHLVRHHMFPEFQSEAGARKFINRVGPDHVDDLMLMREADLKGKPAGNNVENMRGLVQSVRAKKDPTGAAALAINGKDLIAMGVPPGPGLGGILQHLLEMVIENPMLNQRETLLQMAQEYNAAV